jgi:hypothetical protein
MNRLRIVKRAYGEYADFCSFIGTHLAAIEFAAGQERQNSDGEYLVRGLDEPNWTPSSSFQSGFDWL